MNAGYSTGNDIVDRISEINMTGNIIPHNWYKNILFESRKPDLIAIVILADVVYWYRPTEFRDEHTGDVIGRRKKFQADKLQRNYEQIAEAFGVSKRQAKRAVANLEKIGVIKKEFRNIRKNGVTSNNVLYLELIPDRLRELTYEVDEELTIRHSNVTPMTLESDRIVHSNVVGASSKRQTNTENTTKTTNEDFSIISYQAEMKFFKEQISYDAIRLDRPTDIARLDEIVKIAVDVLTSSAKTIRVNKEERNIQVVQG